MTILFAEDDPELARQVLTAMRGQGHAITLCVSGTQALSLALNREWDMILMDVSMPGMEGFEVVKIGDIVSCEAHDNFTDFHFANRPKMMICRSLKFYEDLLAESGFMRIHKSHLINLEHVLKYLRGKGGEITMSDGMVVPVSPQRKEALLERFERGR